MSPVGIDCSSNVGRELTVSDALRFLLGISWIDILRMGIPASEAFRRGKS